MHRRAHGRVDAHARVSVRAYSRVHRRAKREWLPAIAGILLLCVGIGVPYAIIRTPVSASERQASSASATSGLPDVLGVSVRASGYPVGYCDVINGETPKNFLSSANRAWLVLLLPAVIFLFIGLAIVTDEYFVPSLERICERLELSEDVAGATFMAAGSSAPELFTSLLGALWFRDDVGVGTIVGSAVFNILIIIGLSAALAKDKLDLDWRPLMRDSFFYVASVIMLIVSLLWVGGYEGKTAGFVMWWEGLIFILAYVMYILFIKFLNKPYFAYFEKNKAVEEDGAIVGSVEDPETGSGAGAASGTSAATEGLVTPSTNPPSPMPMPMPNAPPSPTSPHASASQMSPTQTFLERYNSKYFERNPRSHMRVLTYAIIAANSLATSSDEHENQDDVERHIAEGGAGGDGASGGAQPEKLFLGIKKPKTILGWATLPVFLPWHVLYHFTIVDCAKENLAKWWLSTFVVSIIWIMIISYLMVEATRLAGCFIGIPSAVMGLTFLAAGTSVPDALASVSVARNGYGNMAVSNAIGSNVFDILLGLGLPWFIAGFVFGKTEVTVEPVSLIVIPIAILFAVIILLVIILVLLKWKLSKVLGYILFGLYGVFVTYSLVDVFVISKSNT